MSSVIGLWLPFISMRNTYSGELPESKFSTWWRTASLQPHLTSPQTALFRNTKNEMWRIIMEVCRPKDRIQPKPKPSNRPSVSTTHSYAASADDDDDAGRYLLSSPLTKPHWYTLHRTTYCKLHVNGRSVTGFTPRGRFQATASPYVVFSTRNAAGWCCRKTLHFRCAF